MIFKTLKLRKRTLIIIISIATPLALLFGFWVWLLASVPSFVNNEYNDYAGENHTSTSLSRCFGDKGVIYKMKVIFATANVQPGYSIGYLQFYDLDHRVTTSEGYPLVVDLDTSGVPVDFQNPYGICVPVKWEIGAPTP